MYADNDPTIEKKPKLRTSAAEMRYLVPILHRLAQRFLLDADAVEAAAKSAAFHLNECYKALADDVFYHARLTEHSTAFALQLVALADAHAHVNYLWKLKPKLHQWLELCAEGQRPSRCWTYRDEDFGGSCARSVHIRGGRINPTAISFKLLTNFKLKQPIIVVR